MRKLLLTGLSVALFAIATTSPFAQPPSTVTLVPGGMGTMQWGDMPDGVVKNGKPVEKGWKSLFDGKTLNGWLGEKGYWQVKDGAIMGDKIKSTPHHHYMFSKQDYSDFELHIDVKMTGYNSGVCCRIHPASYDDVPGYQVDMGDGYWGCLWDEHHRQKKIFDYPQAEQDKLVRKNDWNHYYFRCYGHHVTIFLNGVKTADGDDPGGFDSGPLGFQLCHGDNTVASFKNIYVKTKFKVSGPNGKPMTVGDEPLPGTAPKPAENPEP